MQNNQALMPDYSGTQISSYPVQTDFQRQVVCILGLPFDVISTEQAVDKLSNAAHHYQRCFLSTPNLNFVVASLAGGAFRDSVIRSDLSVADGMPLVWIAKLLGLPVTERVAGSTLFERLRTRTDGAEKLRVYFFGGPDGVAATAAEKLNASASGLVCTGYESPGFGSIEQMSTPAIINRINASQADFVVVALGAKKGQAWIEHNLAALDAPLISHLGAVVNFVAGTVVRAPRWIQRIGGEWLWRIWEEPSLWRRYLHDGFTLIRLMTRHVLPCALMLRLRKPELDALLAARIEMQQHTSHISIHASGAWDERNLTAMRTIFAEATTMPFDIRIDFSGVTHIDSACIGLLLLLYGHQTKVQRDFVLHGVRPDVLRVLRWCCADYLVSEQQTAYVVAA